MIFQILTVVVLYIHHLYAGSIRTKIDKPDIQRNGVKNWLLDRENCDDVKGFCCVLGKKYQTGDIFIDDSIDDNCYAYMCVDDRFKAIGGVTCATADSSILSTRKILEQVVQFLKNQPNLTQNQLNKQIYAKSIKKKLSMNFRRGIITTHDQPTAPTPGPTPTRPPSACYDLSLTTGRSGNWCYGTVCINGQKVPWDNFNCGTTAATPFPREPTTTPTTTPFYFTPLHCVYNENNHYSFHRGGSSFVNLDGVKCKCTYYGRVECDADHVVG